MTRHGHLVIGIVLILLGVLFWCGVGLASAPTPVLSPCEEQLADVRGAVMQIHLPTAAFQAETLVTLNRKLATAQARDTQQAATIDAKQQALDAVSAQLAESKTQQETAAVTIAGLHEVVNRHTQQSQDREATHAVTMQVLQQEIARLRWLLPDVHPLVFWPSHPTLQNESLY